MFSKIVVDILVNKKGKKMFKNVDIISPIINSHDELRTLKKNKK